MKNNPLNIVYTDEKKNNSRALSNTSRQREETQNNMERHWIQDPNQFDPKRNCMECNRLKITLNTILTCTELLDKRVADLGCGAGVFTRMLCHEGAMVDAVDVAPQALQRLQSESMDRITPIQDYIPSTSLSDQTYDLVVCTEVIGYLKPRDYRLLMAELARLIKNNGLVACSTSLDINTEDPLDRFSSLAETEFSIDKWILSYHLLQIRLCHFFEAPSVFVKAGSDREIRENELKERKGIGRLWFLFNTYLLVSFVWRPISFVLRPVVSLLRQNEWLMNKLEAITRFIWSDAGISHALFIGRRRPLTFPVKEDKAPRELKHKRQVWE